MGQLTISFFINRSQQDVFDFLSNPANLPKWKDYRYTNADGD